MQDNIPDALIEAFERHYDCSWDNPSLRNERLAWRAAWAEATKPCLLQITEPQAAPAAVAGSAEVVGLLEALESMVDVCEGHDFDGAPSDAHMGKARAAISAYRAALAATPAADAPAPQQSYVSISGELKPDVSVYSTPAAAHAALTTPQPFGYVVTTPAGVELFYRHPADLAIHNDRRAETVYTLPAVLAAAPVVQPEPVDAEKETQAVMQLVADYTRKAVLESSGNYPEITLAQMNEAWSAIFGKVRALLAQAATAAAHQAQADARDTVTVPVSALSDMRKGHIYMGLCPEDSQPDSRDDECPCCKAIVTIDAAIAAAKGK